MGSLNIAGISDYKLRILQEVHNFDVLCLQETWLTGAVGNELQAEGFTFVEQRRA